MNKKIFLPENIQQWKLAGDIESYDRESIFKYMDGAGEVYRLYSYKSLHVAHYQNKNQPELLVEIFDMGSSEDAYGVFTHAYSGEQINIGQGAYGRPGFIAFWKDRYFIIVSAREETPEIKNALPELAEIISRNIKQAGKMPAILQYLPDEGLLKESVRYFHNRNSLNYHYFISTDNILNLDDNTDAILAEYKTDSSNHFVLLIKYGNPDEAKHACYSFINGYIPEAKDSGIMKIEDGTWTAARFQNNYLVVVLEAKTEKEALIANETLLKKMEKK